ncbi:hypothetical protein [Candidatus Hydrogenosomobacter endosymbioticus]|uniref:Uncharacterized protein n=1 Tax=Candidatus Hydrogenosomobacter endosymbioticus TaxID=2558174 RepID=A0ABN6L2G0_9PROT|nr:hypothetical protein [Candidatus Hydrogenosomobacter endosymbioticus]BDB96026.1 hypothetical protein HYD_1590 [Candidatus Hydrogenosomobacter endosymbioticus]
MSYISKIAIYSAVSLSVCGEFSFSATDDCAEKCRDNSMTISEYIECMGKCDIKDKNSKSGR